MTESPLTQTLPVIDIYGNPILTLTVQETSHRHFTAKPNQFSPWSFLVSDLPYIFIKSWSCCSNFILLEKFVLSQLARPSVSVSNIGASGDISRRIKMTGKMNYQILLMKSTICLSELEQSDKTLKESEEKYQTAFASAMNDAMLLDEKGFFDCNASALKLFGYESLDEFSKNDPAYLSPPVQPDGTPSLEALRNIFTRR